MLLGSDPLQQQQHEQQQQQQQQRFAVTQRDAELPWGANVSVEAVADIPGFCLRAALLTTRTPVRRRLLRHLHHQKQLQPQHMRLIRIMQGSALRLCKC
ncbi:hypothetical protein EPH_0060030 [Eimeria praecox]|uniref:Uncharacterized protein n=1 Tax=Eimeria praecox TaxID=51316 RepID=U6H0B5_9EIME|nr:hypothetical protein EPH_0060030 [Eimeria praecox]